MANVNRQRARRKRPQPKPRHGRADAWAIFNSATGPGLAACPIWAKPGGKPLAAPPLDAADLEAARAFVPKGFKRRAPTAGDKADNPLLIEVWYAPR